MCAIIGKRGGSIARGLQGSLHIGHILRAGRQMHAEAAFTGLADRDHHPLAHCTGRRADCPRHIGMIGHRQIDPHEMRDMRVMCGC